MGKTMQKSSIIYGENHSQTLKGWNKWGDVEDLIRQNVGSKPKIDLAGAKQTVKEAQADKRMASAYLKVGLIGNDLVLRCKENRFLGDIEYDAVLVKNYKTLAASYKGSNDETADKGRHVVQVVNDKLKDSKSRRELWSNLKVLGAKDNELKALDTFEDAQALFRKLDLDAKLLPELNGKGILLSEKGVAMQRLSSHANDREAVYELLEVCGARPADLSSLDTPGDVKNLVKKLKIVEPQASWLATQDWMLSDKGQALQQLEKSRQPDQIRRLLKNSGMPISQFRQLYAQGGSIDVTAVILVKFGLSRKAANELAGIIVDSDDVEEQLIEKLKTDRNVLSNQRLLTKILDEVGMKKWRQRVEAGSGSNIDSFAEELRKELDIDPNLAQQITEMYFP